MQCLAILSEWRRAVSPWLPRSPPPTGPTPPSSAHRPGPPARPPAPFSFRQPLFRALLIPAGLPLPFKPVCTVCGSGCMHPRAPAGTDARPRARRWAGRATLRSTIPSRPSGWRRPSSTSTCSSGQPHPRPLLSMLPCRLNPLSFPRLGPHISHLQDSLSGTCGSFCELPRLRWRRFEVAPRR